MSTSIELRQGPSKRQGHLDEDNFVSFFQSRLQGLGLAPQIQGSLSPYPVAEALQVVFNP